MPRVSEYRAGQWLGRFPDDKEKILAFGYRFYPPGRGRGAFCGTYGRSTVYVYATIETWRPGMPKPETTSIVAEQAVGEARLVRDADKIGRKGVRDIVRPALAAYFTRSN